MFRRSPRACTLWCTAILEATLAGTSALEGAEFAPRTCEPAGKLDWMAAPLSPRAEPPPGNPHAYLDDLEAELYAPRFQMKTFGSDTNLCMSWEMAAASDPNNPQRLAMIQGSRLGVSIDGGDSFTFVSVGNFLPSTFTSAGDGSVAYDSSGRLFVSILGNPVAAGGWRVFVSRHNPVTGALISGPVNVSAAVGIATSATSDKPWIAADAHPLSDFADNVYVVWSVTGGALSGSFEIWGAYSTDQGATWNQMTNTGAADIGPISPMDASDGTCWPPHIAVARNGNVFVSYHGQPGFLIDGDGSNGPPDGISGKVVVWRSTDGGATFPVAQRSEPFPASFADTTWNSQSNDTGAIPDARFWTIGTGAGYVLPDPDTACTLHVVTTDDPDDNPTSGDAADVVMATSTDCGVTWPKRQKVSDGLTGTWQLLPAASIDAETGAIAVSWLDNRNAGSYPAGSAGNARVDLRARYSLDNGVSWLPSLIVNDQPIDPDASTSTIGAGIPSTYRIGEYNGLAFAECSAHLFWPGQATCNGTIDTYYDRDPQVSDFDPPDITCPGPESVGCNDSLEPAALGVADARDACDGDPSVIHVDDHQGGTCPDGGTILDSIDRIWSATDAAGNINTCTQKITIVDFDAPDVSVPQPIELECTAKGGVPAANPQIQGWLDEGEAIDACTTATLDLFGVPALFPVSCDGSVKTWISFIGTDECGNADFPASTVTVVDTIGPNVSPPPPRTFECTEPGGIPSDDPEVVEWLESAITLDVCSDVVLTNDAPDLLPAGCAPGTVTAVNFTGTDGCGNASVDSANAIVVDGVGPDITSPVVHHILLPPDHGYQCFDNVRATPTLADVCGARTSATTVTCTSSQCDDAPCAEHPGEAGDGNTTEDCIYDAGLDQLCARAERASTDPAGRHYTVTLTASDGCGNENEETILELHVPLGCLEGDADCLFKDGFESGPALVWTDSVG